MNWIMHQGDFCPVALNDMVEVEMLDGSHETWTKPHKHNWRNVRKFKIVTSQSLQEQAREYINTQGKDIREDILLKLISDMADMLDHQRNEIELLESVCQMHCLREGELHKTVGKLEAQLDRGK